jgi:hypothetical protein
MDRADDREAQCVDQQLSREVELAGGSAGPCQRTKAVNLGLTTAASYQLTSLRSGRPTALALPYCRACPWSHSSRRGHLAISAQGNACSCCSSGTAHVAITAYYTVRARHGRIRSGHDYLPDYPTALLLVPSWAAWPLSLARNWPWRRLHAALSV